MQYTSRFRKARGRRLAKQIELLARHKGIPISIIDLGGRADYWNDVAAYQHIKEIHVVNLYEEELDWVPPRDIAGKFIYEVGNACDLTDLYHDKEFDLAHSNSVIEHVGLWPQQHAMAKEAKRLGKAGWVQTPAYEFFFEPHHNMPFIHWTGQPLRRKLLRLRPFYWHTSVDVRRAAVDRTNLLSYKEYKALFPECDIYIERFALMKKSYVAQWLPSEIYDE